MVEIRLLLLAPLAAVCLFGQPAEMDWNAPVMESRRLQDGGQIHAAEKVLLSALSRAENEAPDERWTAAFSHHLGGLYYLLGRYGDSERFYLRALRVWEKFAATNSHQLAVTANDLVGSYITRGLYRKALTLFDGPLARHMNGLGADPQGLRWRNGWVAVLVNNGKLEEAESLSKTNLKLLQSSLAPDEFATLASINHLGIICSKTNRPADAIEHFNSARDLASRLFPKDRPERLKPCLNLAEMHLALGHKAEADGLFRSVLAEARANIAPDNLFQAEVRLEYAAALKQMNRLRDAKKLEKEARAIQARSAAGLSSRHTVDVSQLGTQ